MRGSAKHPFRSKILLGALIISTLAIAYALYGIAAQNSSPAKGTHRQSGRSGPIVIKGEKGTVINHLNISSSKGDCVKIEDSANITIKNSEIGPCLGSGIRITGGSGIDIYDNYIHPEAPLSACCDRADGIFASSTTNLTIQGNVIAYGESNIEVLNVTGAKFIGNFLLNPRNTTTGSRGLNFQSWNNSRDLLVENNYTISSTDTSKYKFAEQQEDSINFGDSTGIIVRNNYISGGHSPSGCGIIADYNANDVQFLNNTLVNTGQCGISISDGTNHAIIGNNILNETPVPGGGNTAISIWKQYRPPCGSITVSHNIAAEVRADGTVSSFWNGGGCDPVKVANNVFGPKAVRMLSPISKKLPPPPIPPQPYACPAPSPFTNRSGCTSSPDVSFQSSVRPLAQGLLPQIDLLLLRNGQAFNQ